MKQQKGKLVVITGSSGVGKDSVIEGLIKRGLEFSWVVTTTAREPREGESEGKPYYFVSRKKFKEMIKNDELLEWAEVYGNYYGSTKEEVQDRLVKNSIVILKPDPVGAMTIKKNFPKCLTIFIAPPSFEILKKRLVGRKTDSPEAIERRLAKVREEMKMSKDFDEVIVNEEGELDKTVEKLLVLLSNI